MGQETEYAIRFSPAGAHPGNDKIYDALAFAISRLVRTKPGLYSERPQIFTENGGAFHYEYLPYCAEGGLIEGATPECRGPGQLVLYQRAQEALLLRAIPRAERELAAAGYAGKLGLLKNCRDAEGHIYGAQESFECELSRGAGLFLYRLGIVLLIPPLAVTLVVAWALALGIALATIVFAIGAAIVGLLPPFRRRRWFERILSLEDRTIENGLGRVLYWMSYVVLSPVIGAFTGLLWLTGFRRIRRRVLPFLVSRAVFSGAGSILEGGRFVLSEKAPAVNRKMRLSISPSSRAIFDTGNLMKPVLAAAIFHASPLVQLFSRRQRLQLGLADANMLEEAEFLKLGTTALVIDMAEAGWLRDAPTVTRPIAALHALVADPSLETTVATNRGPQTALEIQRYYLERAKAFLRQSKTTSMEASEVVEQWEDVLTALECREMNGLVGRLDWVTKRYLLEACGSSGDGSDWSLLKTIDLRYHELGEGYASRFARSGHVLKLLAPAEIERAITEPPADTPALSRGRFIRAHAPSLTPVRVSWRSALVGGRIRGKLIRFPGAE